MARLGKPKRLAPHHVGPGLRVRFSRIRGVTPRGLLDEPLRLPVVLGDFSVSEDADWRDYTTVSAGNFSSPAPGGRDARSLQQLGLDTMSIDWHAYARFLTHPQVTPAQVRRTLTHLLRARAPFEMLAMVPGGGDGPSEEWRGFVGLRNVQRTLRAREADTRYFTITLSEWRDNRIDRRGRGQGGHGGRGHLPTTAHLDDNDTLESLSKHYYGTKTDWRLIARANGIRNWGQATPLVQSHRFKKGDKVKIPALQTAGINSPDEGAAAARYATHVPVPHSGS